MQKEKIDQFIMVNADKFPQLMIEQIRQKLEKLDESKESMLMAMEWKSPKVALLLAIFVSFADRMYLGQVGLGVAKLLTCGGVGIWSLVDLFSAMSRARMYNYNKLMMQFGLDAK